jgi:hypothetical protein
MALSERRRNAAPCRAHYQGTCDACEQWGHQSNTCNKAGAWAFLCHFHKNWTNTSIIEEAEKAWIKRNKAFLQDGDNTPKKVFYTYCDRLGIDMDQVMDKIDWDFFSDGGL